MKLPVHVRMLDISPELHVEPFALPFQVLHLGALPDQNEAVPLCFPERSNQVDVPLALAQPVRGDERERRADLPILLRLELIRVDAVRNDRDPAAQCVLRKFGQFFRVGRDDRRVSPDCPRKVLQDDLFQKAEADFVAGHVITPQGNDIGSLFSVPIPEEPWRPAVPAVADVVGVFPEQFFQVEVRAKAPLEHFRPRPVVQVLLADSDPVKADMV